MFAAELTYWNVSRKWAGTQVCSDTFGPCVVSYICTYTHASFSELIICISFVMYVHTCLGLWNFADIWIYLHLPPDRYEL